MKQQLNLREMIKQIIKEEQALSRKISIKYIPVDKHAYTTQTTGIKFKVMINGKQAEGYWRPSHGRYVSQGVDINELELPDRKVIKIFDGGGTHKTYEISADLKEVDKQPKDLRFTGPRLSIDNLKVEFVNKIKKAMLNPDAEPKLSKEFLQYFNSNS